MLIDIATTDSILYQSLHRTAPQGVSVQARVRLLKAEGTSDSIVGIVIDIATRPVSQVLIGVVSAWLYDKLKQRGTSQVTINRKQIDLTEGNITRIVEETIQVKK